MNASIHRFADLRLDPATRTLWRGDAPVPVPPKALDCIGYLIEHRERAVGRDELIAAVWGKVDISDNALGQAILQARRALGAHAEAIRTVPRYGYHWQLPLLSEPGEATQPEPAPAPSVAMPAAPVPETIRAATMPMWRNRSHWAIAAALLAVVALAVFDRLRPGPPDRAHAQPAAAMRDALVLPARVDADPEHGWMRLGVMDLVAGRLRASGQTVVPSDNVVALAQRRGGGEADPAFVAELLRVTGAARAVTVTAEAGAEGWVVSLASTEGVPAAAVGQAPDVLDAARQAADQFARVTGFTPAPSATGDAEQAFATLIQQVDAELLAGRLDAARQRLDAATPDQQGRAELAHQRAQIDFLQGRLGQAEMAWTALLTRVSIADAPVLRARIHNGLANLAYVREDHPTVIAQAEAAVRALEGQHAPYELGRALIGLASGHGAQRRYDEALADYAQARVAFAAAGDRLALARVDAYQGLLDFARGRPGDALPVLADAAERLQAFGALIEELHTRVGVVYAQLALLQPAQALAQNARLLELGERVGDPRRRHYADLARARSLAATGRLAEAQAIVDALGTTAVAHPAELLAQTRSWLPLVAGQLALMRDDPADAVDEAAGAIAVTDAGDAHDRSTAYWLGWRALQRAGRTGEAAGWARDAAAWNGARDHAGARIRLALIEAGAAAGRGDEPAAQTAYARALAEADAWRVPADLLQVARAYTDHLIERGDLAQASVVAGRIAAWAPSDFEAALLQVALYRAVGQTGAWRAALAASRSLAGERAIPPDLLVPPPGRTAPDADGGHVVRAEATPRAVAAR
ncbi:MAG TPA: winged helix-turn-helix domain-containing protein [Dokdonella sp.]|uniref:winged helix-turn-helix domain-containing protein n=1 Tax=Dokdonella sp. TaxID=2291710 RepID=UPI002C5FC660|nr:winged helix-turn-helix domain-containing protein [Dokdonella sp.]HUD42522.1 winged helix-turn-helix domain-containing protein [Dokdonella sp.]